MSDMLVNGEPRKTEGPRRRRAVTREKVAVSVPRSVIDRARTEIREGRAHSLSALVSEALADKLKTTALAEILDSWDTEYGPPSEEDDIWARRVLGI